MSEQRISKRPQRERQITQDLIHANSPIAFAADETVRALQYGEVDVETQLPSRVEGRFRMTTVKRRQLGEVAIYQNLPELLSGERLNAMQRRTKDSWTIDDIPADVREKCDTWVCDRIGHIVPILQQAARDILQEPTDYMEMKQQCPHCKYHDPQFACRASGWDREVYSYPLMRLRDDITGEVFEVPFDVALYIDEHTPQQILTAVPAIDFNGRLTTTLELGVISEGVSAGYVARVTDGRVQPESPMLSATLDQRYLQSMRRALDRWQEPDATQDSQMPAFTKLLKGDPSGWQMIVELQNAAVGAYVERAVGVDYNQLFQSVRQNLGAKGLLLAFGWHYQGQGESEASYQILTPAYERVGGWVGVDPVEALIELSERIDAPEVMRPRSRISGTW